MSQWVAEITNNLDKDYDVYVELLEDDEYKARLEIGRLNRPIFLDRFLGLQNFL